MRRLWIAVAVLLVLEGCRRQPSVAPDTLVVLADHDVESLEPHTSGQVRETQSALSNLYEGLVTFDTLMALKPALASSWSNPDEVTWDFEIRPGVTFHTGGVMTAEDVVFSLERARTHPRSAFRVALTNVARVTALDGRRVRLTTREPDAYLIARLRQVFVVSKAFVESRGEAALVSFSAGTGPYAVSAYRPGASLDLERHKAYWRGPAAIPRVRIVPRVYGDREVASYLTPSSRLLFTLRPDSPKTDEARRDFVAHESPSLAISYLAFDLLERETPGVRLAGGASGNPFRNADVREAIALALGTEKLRAAGFVSTQLVPQTVFGFDPTIPVPRPNLETARALLQRTPYRDG